MSTRLIAMFVGVMAVAIVVAGCGSSSDDSTVVVLTKAEFIKQGDAICKQGSTDIETEIDAYAKEHDIDLEKQPSQEQFKEISENVVVPGVRSQLEDLRELGVPDEGEDLANELLDSLEEGVEKGEEDPVRFVSAPTLLAKANKLAEEFGFKECGQE